MSTYLDRCRGCLLGGAAGDALGYPVEFLSAEDIRADYGSAGITGYALSGGKALISDDTQLTLFTADALIRGRTREAYRGIRAPYPTYAAKAYQEWLRTQREPFPLPEGDCGSWLVHVPELFRRRAPGSTCLEAIAQGAWGSPEHPINRSKGCGGIMRVAPAGLLLADPEEAGLLAAQLAALTHGHELGWLPAGVLGHCVSALAHGRTSSLSKAAEDAMVWAQGRFDGARHLPELTRLVDRAFRLARDAAEDAAALRALGEGWVAEETLAVALYCALRYEDDFDRALIAAVNHSGDSDSTGAVTGNLVGARLGLAGIPAKYRERLELREVILELAEDLAAAGGEALPETERWAAKYVTAAYTPPRR